MNFQEAEFVLLIGDFHVPNRAAEIPPCFRELLKNEKITNVVCTGNLGSADVLSFVQSIGSRCVVARGESDGLTTDLPDSDVLKVGDIKIGVVNGYQAIPWGDIESLKPWLYRLDCDILVTGFTHIQGAFSVGERRMIINPGSATGAKSFYQPPENIPVELEPTGVAVDEKTLENKEIEDQVVEGVEEENKEIEDQVAEGVEEENKEIEDQVVEGGEEEEEADDKNQCLEAKKADIVSEEKDDASLSEGEAIPPEANRPSFALLTLKGRQGVVYFYQELDGTPSVHATEFSV